MFPIVLSLDLHWFMLKYPLNHMSTGRLPSKDIEYIPFKGSFNGDRVYSIQRVVEYIRSTGAFKDAFSDAFKGPVDSMSE